MEDRIPIQYPHLQRPHLEPPVEFVGSSPLGQFGAVNVIRTYTV